MTRDWEKKMSFRMKSWSLVLSTFIIWVAFVGVESQHDYADALSKSILFFEGQRSGKLPSNQRMNWRKNSALDDGHQIGVDLVGGYYDAGDNVKFGFPMAFSTTLLAWSVVEYGALMGSELQHAEEAVRWATDYLLKATSNRDVIYVQVGEPYEDHNCWQRPEDMNTPRTVYVVDKDHPGSEVAAETAAALAAASLVFRLSDPTYSSTLLNRATEVFDFADRYQGSYSQSIGSAVCPFYCDFSGYKDELLWAAAWLHKATNMQSYWNYVMSNMNTLGWTQGYTNPNYVGPNGEFGWDNKHAGIDILISNEFLTLHDAENADPFYSCADEFVCSVVPESPSKCVEYSPGGLIFKPGGSNMQHSTAISFLLLVHAGNLIRTNRVVHCGNIEVSPSRLIQVAKSQVDYILGSNPLGMSYMVGYGDKFPQKIHHRASSLPSMDNHPDHIDCKGGTPYFQSQDPNPNLLIGAVVGGPNATDGYPDSRDLFQQSEPTTYINAPFVGALAFFKSHNFL
ncbi:hypothetical protein AAC387_Pa06g0744 [Persea americana]